MKLIVGLGNPGKKYEKTRHNAGFMLADKLQKEWNFPDFKFDEKFNAEISKKELSLSLRSRLGGRSNPEIKDIKSEIAASSRPGGTPRNDILLIKPQTFMNNSGQTVKKIMKFYKIKPANIIVIHDDLDIDLGEFKISEDSRAAGHNGVESVISTLGTKKFTRVRIGIEGEEKRKTRKIPGDEFVLKDFTPAENKTIQKISGEIISSLQKILS